MRDRSTTLQFFAPVWIACITVLAMLTAICPSSYVSATATTEPPIRNFSVVDHSQDDLLLLLVQIDQYTLQGDIDAYLYPKGLLVPLGAMCDLLELGIKVDAEDGKASGFVIEERRTFSLDVGKRQVTLTGKTTPLDISLLEVHHNDIYVDTKLLGQWISSVLDINYRASTLRVISQDLLPIQQRLLREQQKNLIPITGKRPSPNYEQLRHPYHLWSGPCIDQSLYFSNQHGKNGFRYSSLITADLLYMNSSVYLFNGDNGNRPEARVTFGRSDPYGQLLGRLRAREFAFGDVYSPTLPLVSTSRSGEGFVVSNYPLDQPSEFGTHTFQGDAPPGWDIELYRDNILLRSQAANDNGRYEFRDIPLLIGMNNFRLVFYGPHGEKRVEEHRFNVGESLMLPRESFYRVGFTRIDEGGTDLIWQQDYGVRENLSVNGGLASLQLRDGTKHHYANLGFRGFWQGFFTESNLAFDQTGGWGVELGTQTRVGPMSAILQAKQLQNLSSDAFQPSEERLRTRVNFRLDNIPVPRIAHLQPMSLEFSRDLLTSGLERYQVSHRLSADLRGLNLSNFLEYGDERISDTYRNKTMRGTVLLSRYLQRTQLRGEAYYDLYPDFRLHTVGLSSDFLLPRDYALSLVAMHSVSDSRSSLQANLRRAIGAYSIGILGNYSTTGAFTAGLTLSAGLGREPRTGQWRTDAQPFASRGIASACVFLDSNQNGLMDSDEKPLPHVGFFINDRDHERLTNTHGIALLNSLPTNSPTDISVSMSTLDDPMWIPESPGFRFVPRPGNPLQINFPIIVTGEISGTVSVRRNNIILQPANVPIDLLNSKGDIVQSAKVKTGFDGFYNIPKLPTGRYTVRIAPEYLTRTALRAPVHIVTIPAEGGFIDGVDFLLEIDEPPLVVTHAESPVPTPGIVIPVQDFQPQTDIVFQMESRIPSITAQRTSRRDISIAPKPHATSNWRAPRPGDGVYPGIVVPAAVHFAYDQSILSPKSIELLNDVLRFLKGHPNVRIHLVGHADIRGSKEYNIALSKRRIEAVRAYLIAHGISNSRITAQAVGKEYPVMDGVTPIVHAFNRVVEIFYIAPSLIFDTTKSGVDLQIEDRPQAPAGRQAAPAAQQANKRPARSPKAGTPPPEGGHRKSQPKPGSIDFEW